MKEKRDFDGRPSFFFEDIKSGRYSRIAKNLARRFKLQPEGRFVDTTDTKLQEYSCRNLLVSLEWEQSDGFSVNSRNADSDQMTEDIAEYVHKKYRA
ncbi:MAG: hypothetical protein AB8G18_17345 [Gammaproteobacteria bacterium]